MVSMYANNWCKAFSFLGFLLQLLVFNNNNHRCHAAAATTAAAASLIDNYDAHNLSGRGLKGEAEAENNSVVCTTEDQCKEKFLSMGTGGAFLVGEYPTKGCFSKNSNVYFGTGAMVEEELAVTDLPGIQERIWCDKEPDHAKNSENPSANPTQVPPAEFIPTRQSATQVLEPTASLSTDDDGVNVDIGTVTGIPSTAVICSQDQCREKFLGLAISSEDGGRFIVGDFPTKGCFSKKSNVYYSIGSDSTIAELAENELPGAQTRLWCERETESRT